MSGNDKMTEPGKSEEAVSRLLATYGTALERWPDADQAADARRRLMSDRAFRSQWEGERDLDRALAGLRAELDGEIAHGAAMERVTAGIIGGVAARLRPLDGIRWRSLAAAMVLAAILGGAFQTLRPPAHAEPLGPVVLDPTLPEFEEPLL
jgi:hypothetical protein